MKFRLHPILLPLFGWLIYIDGFSMYALIFTSLLFHELGHVVAARLCKVSIQQMTIMPYGGEIIFSRQRQGSRVQQIGIVAGGPLATLLILLVALSMPFPGQEIVVRIQLALLCLNLLPIYPLDGGRLLAFILMKQDEVGLIPERIFHLSILLLIVSFGILWLYVPDSLPYIALTVFLIAQNISLFRFRKYEKILVALRNNQLTE